MLTSILLIFAGALVFAIGATPVARWLAPHVGVIDHPSARKVHARPMPRLGGAAIFLAFILALVVFENRYNFQQLAGILIGATFVSFLGIWDDRWGLRPILKLIGQILGALILVMAGVHTELFPWPALDVALTVLWVVGITNAFNLLDNMDGLSGGVGAVAAAFFMLLAAMSRPPQVLVAALSAALLGVCLGFLAYNFNPATIFMGDAGAMFIGYTLAAVGIKLRFLSNITFVTWMIPVLVLGVPIFDTTLVFFSRLRRGLNPLTTPGKDHSSHRLVAMGFTQREAVLILYLIGGGLGVLAMFITQADVIESYVIFTGVLVAGILGILRLERPQLIPTKSGPSTEVPGDAKPS
jgi:UDP-GlcNAc:undecaprenyl-phosphate/decaprenyl-phosphate GlcNAc-1-phosphate transferase